MELPRDKTLLYGRAGVGGQHCTIYLSVADDIAVFTQSGQKLVFVKAG